MKIEIQDTTVEYGMLECGDVFSPGFSNELYIKLKGGFGNEYKRNAARLSDGFIDHFDDTNVVIKRNVKIVSND